MSYCNDEEIKSSNADTRLARADRTMALTGEEGGLKKPASFNQGDAFFSTIARAGHNDKSRSGF
jgi:hypothetical protein